MVKYLVNFFLLIVICVKLSLCFIGGEPGKSSLEVNKLYQQQQEQEKVSIFFPEEKSLNFRYKTGK